jgi:hypothetical protein|tara:strand:+ start:4007 stop:4963 length:957 start_codon:yes stop_codon:yes gene_type:complete
MVMNRMGGTQQPLAQYTTNELRQMAAGSHVQLHDLMGLANTQGQLAELGVMHQVEIPKVNFYPSRHPDPRKARRKDIKQAYRLLRPTKRSIFSPIRIFGGKYRYEKSTTHCVIDGCDIDHLVRTAGNLYDEIRDEETGKSLWELYFHNSVTGEPEAFIAREGVTTGRKMRGTYCPEHLHLYHLLCKWEKAEEMEKEATSGTLKAKLRKGVSTVTVPVAATMGMKQDNTPQQLQKYKEFFRMLKQDNIPIVHLKNKVTGKNSTTMIIFHEGQFLNGMNMPILDAIMAEDTPQPPQTTLSSLLSEASPPPMELPDAPKEA